MKCCVKCNIEKDDGDFRSGRKVCNLCLKEYAKQWRQNNAEVLKQKSKQYYQNNTEKRKQYYQSNVEAIKEYRKQYRQNNKTYSKEYYQNNADKIKERSREYNKDNPEKKMLNTAKKRAKQKNVPFNINEEDVVVPSICPILGIPLERGLGKKVPQPNSPSLDRIVPEKGYVKGNVIVISQRANMIKSNATPEEIIAVGEFYKKLLEQTK